MSDQERAIRDRIIVAIGSDDWVDLHAPEPDEYKDMIPQLRFVTSAQMKEADGGGYPPEPEHPTQYPDNSDEAYEQLFEFRVWDLLRFGLANGFLDTLPSENAAAIRKYVRIAP
jgi:hypothetical protein